jgi:anti-sigma B factor antagonist
MRSPTRAIARMRSAVFLLDVHSDGDSVVVAPHGEIDLSTVGRVDDALERSEDSPVVVLDLRGVSFMDSAGLGLVVRHCLRAERYGFEFRVVPGPPAVQRLFEMTGVARRLVWVDALADSTADSH